PDMDPKRGGVVNVIAEDVELFDIRYLDPQTGIWVESWDTTNLTSQPNRLPIEVKITLVLKGVHADDKPYRFVTKAMIPIQQPLSFGIPR
ncbi:MAG TPA: type II secretion system protein GspJ, partial [Labilithrix sp.]